MAKRKFKDWIKAFEEYTASLPTPSVFRQWAGISLVAGALERRVWVNSYNSKLYPNLYVFLISPPGIGKGVLTSVITHFWNALKEHDHHVAPTNMTKAALADALRHAERRIVRPPTIGGPATETFNSLKICSSELSTLVDGNDTTFMNMLTQIYDCVDYSEGRRQGQTFAIPTTQFNLVAATTPPQLQRMLPESGWDEGFMSRTIMVYSGERIKPSLWAENAGSSAMEKKLLEDFVSMGKDLYGPMSWDDDAAEYIDDWNQKDGPPEPTHPKLFHYNTRRTAHALKLITIASVSRSNDLQVTMADVETGLGWLIRAEENMPDVFKALAPGGHAGVIQECWYFLFQIYTKEKKPISKTRLIHFLQERVPVTQIDFVVKAMVEAKFIKEQIDGYLPLANPGMDD